MQWMMHAAPEQLSIPLSNLGRLQRLIADAAAVDSLRATPPSLTDRSDFIATCVGVAIGLQQIYMRRFCELTGPPGERLRDFQRHSRSLARIACRELAIKARSGAEARFLARAVDTATAVAIANASLVSPYHERRARRRGRHDTPIPITVTNPGVDPYAFLSS